MKKLIVIFPIIFALILPLFSMAQNLDYETCPERSVARFDFDVQVSEADIEKMGHSIADYAGLYKVAAGVFNTLFDEDPSSNCLNYFEGALATQIDQGIDTASMPAGDYQASLPPAAGGLSSQYILTGSIARSGGKKVLVRVTLLAEETRELVAEAQLNYDFGMSGFGNGRLAAQQLLPLMGKIREFERMKRDEDPEVAIEFSETKSGMVEIMPDREKLKAQETMDVKVRVTDCDNIPLSGLALTVSGSGGTVDPMMIKSDDNGEATVQYTAPCEAGTYAIGVSFNYYRPFESKNRPTANISNYSEKKNVVVQPGKYFNISYQNALTQDNEGLFY